MGLDLGGGVAVFFSVTAFYSSLECVSQAHGPYGEGELLPFVGAGGGGHLQSH